MSFGNTAGNVGQLGTDKRKVAVGHQKNGGGYTSVYYAKRTRMRVGSNGGNVGNREPTREIVQSDISGTAENVRV